MTLNLNQYLEINHHHFLVEINHHHCLEINNRHCLEEISKYRYLLIIAHKIVKKMKGILKFYQTKMNKKLIQKMILSLMNLILINKIKIFLHYFVIIIMNNNQSP